MIINQDGTQDEKTFMVLTKRGCVELDDNQFFQITPSGKRLELWEGKKEFLNNSGKFYFVKAWNINSIIATYGEEK